MAILTIIISKNGNFNNYNKQKWRFLIASFAIIVNPLIAIIVNPLIAIIVLI